MSFNIQRLALVSAILVLLAVLCGAAGVYLVIDNIESGARQQRAEASARLLSATITARVAHYQGIAQQLATHAAKLGLLDESKAAERRQFGAQFSPSLPHVLKLRLLPAGTREIDHSGVPELSYACFDLLDRSDKGQPLPQAELHVANTPSAHIDVLAPVMTATEPKRVQGNILISLDPAALRSMLATLKPQDGYAELNQLTSKNEVLLVASGGDANLKQSGAGLVQNIATTTWQLVYWPAAAVTLASPFQWALAAGAALAMLVLLALSVALPRQWLRAALKHDSESLKTLFNDIQTGVLMSQYPFRFKEFAELARKLRSTGAEMIKQRHELEEKAQYDSLTGLASRAAFDSKLEHLHQQAHAGLISVLLVADIDNLETINVQLGAGAGNSLIKQFARQLRDALRQSDVVAYLDYGRFGVLFPFTELEKIQPIVDRLRTRISDEFDTGNGLPRAYTWSAGLTLLTQADREIVTVMTRVEAALQQARAEGGNRTVTQVAAA